MSGLKKLIYGTDSDSQTQLNMAVYQEKCIQTAQKKLLDAHKEACSVWSEYSASESNPTVQHLLSQVNSIQQLWNRAQEDFIQQYCSYRNYFLEVLKGERALTEMQKAVDDCVPKINKLHKQLDSVTAKGNDKKSDALTLELGKHLSLKKKAEKDLDTRRENHELFKVRTIRNAVKVVTNCQITLHERCHEMFQTQQLILDYFTASTYCSTKDLKRAQTNSESLMSDLKRKLQPNGEDPESRGTDLEPSQAILDEVVLGNLADVFGGPPLMDNLQINSEDQATYNAIPDLDPALLPKPRKASKGKDKTTGRPLPSTPPTNQLAKPLIGSPAGAAPPPIPPRKSLLRDKTAPKETEEGPEYLEMERDYGLKCNSVYQTGPDDEQNPYYLLAQANSGSKNNSIKSQGSTGSRNDSGLESRGSTKSASSQPDEDVYEVLDSRFSRNSQNLTEDIYEI